MTATVSAIKPEDNRDIRTEAADAIDALVKNAKMSQNAIARKIGISDTSLSQYLGNKYPSNEKNIEAKIKRWLDNHYARQQQAKQLPTAPAFIDTPSAERIAGALSYAQLAGDIAIIYGGAGTGKTKTCRHYAANNPKVWIATMSPATKTTVPALEEVAFALGVKMTVTGAAKVQRAIINAMQGTNGLLIIDEAQHLNGEALDAMRSLHDASEIGLALVGNEQVYTRMTGDNRAAYLDRLFSRIGKRVRLVRPTRGDVDNLIGAWDIKVKDCIDTCREIAAKPGGLRVLTKVLRLATLYAAGGDRDLCCDDILAAYRELGADS